MKKIIILCAVIAATKAVAQDFQRLFSPKPPLAVIDVEGMYSDPSRTGTVDSKIRIYNDEKQNVSIGGKWRRITFKDSDSRLVNYDDIEGGLSYKRNLEQGRFWSLSASYGSASNHAFKSSDVSTFESTALMKFNKRWFGALNYSNNRTFAKNIPLPGFFYVHTMTREKILIFGLPFAFIKVPIGTLFSFQYLGFLPWRHGAKLTLEREGAKPYIFLEQNPESFLPYGRTNEDDRFYWVRREAGVGLEGQLENLKWDIAGGISFAQEFYQAEDFNDDNKSGLIRPDNAGFIRFSLKHRFD